MAEPYGKVWQPRLLITTGWRFIQVSHPARVHCIRLCDERQGRVLPGGDPFSYEAIGENYFDMKRERRISDRHLVLWGDGDQVTVEADVEPVRVLLISGKPLGESIEWYGPIMMNTQVTMKPRAIRRRPARSRRPCGGLRLVVRWSCPRTEGALDDACLWDDIW